MSGTKSKTEKRETITILAETCGGDDDSNIQVAVISLSLAGLIGIQEKLNKAAQIWDEDVSLIKFKLPAGIEIKFISDTANDELAEIIAGRNDSARIEFDGEDGILTETVETFDMLSGKGAILIKNKMGEEFFEAHKSNFRLLDAELIVTGVDGFWIQSQFKNSSDIIEATEIKIALLEPFFN